LNILSFGLSPEKTTGLIPRMSNSVKIMFLFLSALTLRRQQALVQSFQLQHSSAVKQSAFSTALKAKGKIGTDFSALIHVLP
jgi:hypothetical protein